jgi:hypothetical protein
MAATTMCIRLLLSAILLLSLWGGEASAARVRKFPFWASSDGKGTVKLFWLPPGGQWPPGGFRLERIYKKRRVVLKKALRPGDHEKALAALPPEDANAIRQLADKIRGGTLTDEERRHSISSMGKIAATDLRYGRALGVRHTDRVKGSGKLSYRLFPLDADGKRGDAMESNVVNPRKRTRGPARPTGLAAKEHPEGMALTWSDPPASVLSPIVAFRVDRIAGRGKSKILTRKPLVLNRHLAPDRPQFLDADPPRKKLVYKVRSIDIFGRLSAPVRVGISAKNFSPAARPSLASSTVKKPKEQKKKSAPPLSGTPAGGQSLASSTVSKPKVQEKKSASPPSSKEETEGVVKQERPAEGSVPKPISEPAANPSQESAHTVSVYVPYTAPDPEPAQVFAIAERPTPATGGQAKKRADPKKTAKIVPGEGGSPPSPSIVGIAGLGDRVSITFRPGEPEDRTREFLVLRSKSPTGQGVQVGRPLPADARQWEDTTVEAGEYFWYRLVAIDKEGKRSAPSKPKWVAVGSL